MRVESSSGAARRLGVDEKRVSEWWKFKAEITERGQKKKQLQEGGKTLLQLTRSS